MLLQKSLTSDIVSAGLRIFTICGNCSQCGCSMPEIGYERPGAQVMNSVKSQVILTSELAGQDYIRERWFGNLLQLCISYILGVERHIPHS